MARTIAPMRKVVAIEDPDMTASGGITRLRLSCGHYAPVANKLGRRPHRWNVQQRMRCKDCVMQGAAPNQEER